MANGRLDIVIFGATGYTGKHVVKNAAKMCKDRNIKFGVAGRRKDALEAVVKEFASDIEDVPIILADVKDEDSLKKMTERAKVLITCCGPFRLYGEPVIKACIATRTHYIDVTGEEQFMEQMQLEYNEAAKEAGVYVVSACGVDCIPCDLGIIFTQQKFGGEVNAAEVYIKIEQQNSTEKKGSYLNYATWESVVYSLGDKNQLQEIRKKLFPTKLPEFTPKLKARGLVHRSDDSEGWSVSFPSADRAVALRTQQFLYNKYKERPAQVQVYATLKSFFELLAMSIFGSILLLLSRITCGRNLLLKYPAVFTGGLITHENPSPEKHTSLRYIATIVAHGWTEKLAEPTDKHTDPPNKKLVTEVSGYSPAYEMTSILLVLSAIIILTETDKMPDNGGVITPGAAFGKTSLIEQMINHNIKFEVISSTKIRSNL